MAKRRFDTGSGPSQRQLRVGEVVRRALSDVLAQGDVHDPELSRHSITVTEARAAADLRSATVYVMPLGGREPEAALAALDKNRGALRREVARAVKLKFSPDLKFEIDKTFDQMDDTTRLLNQHAVRKDLDRAAEDD